MTVLYILLGILFGLLLLILLVFLLGSASVRIVCNSDLQVKASVLGIPFRLYPKKDEEGKEKKSLKQCKNPQRVLRRELAAQKKIAEKRLRALQKAKEKAHKKKKLKAKKGQPNPNLRENLEMIRALLQNLYGYTHGKIKINVKRMHISVGSDDAAKTAIRYGVILQLATYILEFIETKFNHIERREGDMEIKADYLSDSITADIDIRCGMKLRNALKAILGMHTSYKKERRLALKKAKARVNAASQKKKKNKK
jgi:hypothetical protein